MKAKCKIWKRKQTKPPWHNFNCLYSTNPLVYRKKSQTTTIHPGIFHVRALWADSVSPRMNTLVSRDQFKPIRIREILVVNYNGWSLTRVQLESTIAEIYPEFSPSGYLVSHQALSIRPDIPKLPKRGQMVSKFPRKVSCKSENCCISEIWSILPKIMET